MCFSSVALRQQPEFQPAQQYSWSTAPSSHNSFENNKFIKGEVMKFFFSEFMAASLRSAGLADLLESAADVTKLKLG